MGENPNRLNTPLPRLLANFSPNFSRMLKFWGEFASRTRKRIRFCPARHHRIGFSIVFSSLFVVLCLSSLVDPALVQQRRHTVTLRDPRVTSKTSSVLAASSPSA